jgi:hypothetical protein
MVCQRKRERAAYQSRDDGAAEGSGAAGGKDTADGTEGRQRPDGRLRSGRAQTAMEGVKEGIRLWWWLEEGEEHNAKGHRPDTRTNSVATAAALRVRGHHTCMKSDASSA